MRTYGAMEAIKCNKCTTKIKNAVFKNRCTFRESLMKANKIRLDRDYRILVVSDCEYAFTKAAFVELVPSNYCLPAYLHFLYAMEEAEETGFESLNDPFEGQSSTI